MVFLVHKLVRIPVCIVPEVESIIRPPRETRQKIKIWKYIGSEARIKKEQRGIFDLLDFLQPLIFKGVKNITFYGSAILCFRSGITLKKSFLLNVYRMSTFAFLAA